MEKEVAWLLEEKYHGEKTEGFFADCERLLSGEPLGYIIGYVPFLDTRIYLDNHPLIPRTETEYWVHEVLKKVPNTHPLHVLDLCAGSGCVGVAILKHRQNTQVDFVEIDTKLHATITKNIEYNIEDASRGTVLGGNLFEHVSKKYDYIFSNPPYIDPELDRTTPSVKSHEPHLALYGGTSGLEYIEQIVKSVEVHLAPEGKLYLEHEPEQASDIRNIAQTCGLQAEAFPDQFGIIRYTRINR